LRAELFIEASMFRYKYSEWDGTQDIFEPSADEVLDAISDSLTLHGDVLRALQRLFQLGLDGQWGQRLKGIQELLHQLRELKRRTLDSYDISSVLDDIRDRLDSIVKTEREGIQRRLKEARVSKESQEMAEILERVASRNLSLLDNLPQDIAGAINELASYEFIDAAARRQYEELMDMLRTKVTDAYFRDISQGLNGLSEQDLSRFKDMLRSLNRMLRERMQWLEPDFKGFMEQFGDHFGPERPSSLHELAQMLQRRMAQVQSLLDSMPAEQRQALEELIESILQDEGLRDELAELAANLERLVPMRGLRSQYPFHGEEPLSLTEALRLMEELQELDEMEKQLEGNRFYPDLGKIDPSRLRHYLGEDAYRSFEQLRRLTDVLEEAGYIWRRSGRWELTPRAIRRIGQKALRDIFGYLKKGFSGKHEMATRGTGGDRADDTKEYEFGDPFHIHIERTFMNALQREGPGSPLRIKPEDFEVYQTEYLTQCSTVLMLDMSWSMPMRGNFFAAKKVTLALDTLIRSQFPRDNLYIVGFSDYAREIRKEQLAHVNWNEWVYGTNMHHGFILSRQLLAKQKSGSKQIVMVTDGEPTAHLEGGISYFDYPPDPRTLELTLLEAKRCAQEGIVINTFMLDRNPYIVQFIDLLTKTNRGRAFYTDRENLGRYILVDYLANKRKRIVR